jgi:hypothetical protein
LAEIVARHLTGRSLSAVEAVREVMDLAAELGHVRVGCRADGEALTVRHGRDPELEVKLPRARGKLRSMCASLAVRAGRPGESPILYGGVAFLPPLRDGQPGYTLKMMNTMGEHWFDLAYQGEAP